MQKMKIVVILGAFILISSMLFSKVFAQADPPKDKEYSNLVSGNYQERVDAYEHFSSQRTETIRHLTEIAKNCIIDERNRQYAPEIIKLLGETRAKEATPFLVEHLTFRVNAPSIILQKRDLLTDYPCAYALVSIGLPAIEPLFSAIEERNYPNFTPNIKIPGNGEIVVNNYESVAITTISNILGKRLTECAVRERIANEKDEIKIRNLKYAFREWYKFE